MNVRTMLRVFATLTLVPIVPALAVRAADKPESVFISGVYPHLAVFNSVVKEGRNMYAGGGECGIGAVVPWAGKLWLITYSPHCRSGGSDRLFTIDDNLRLEIRPESVGGTPAGRMIHRESEQLFIGPYAIDKRGNVRVIPYSEMPGRHTAVARHLTDPENKVYYFDMEGPIHEVDVHTLAVKKLFHKAVPGWHGKGAYTGQGRFIVANNGEHAALPCGYGEVVVGGAPQSPEDLGALCEWDGNEWRIIERRQYTDVTGPGGIYGSPDDASPVWTVGWDRRSVLLKVLDGGQWHTFRLPKGTHTYDHRGGCYSEWPRIREVAPDRLLMDMHGIFWDFPKGFRASSTGGLRPLGTHHRYTGDFCRWNGRLLLASDEASLMKNPMVGQAQSNIWFGQIDDLRTWGPRSGWGGPWVGDTVEADTPSLPFACGGFARRCLHLAVGQPQDPTTGYSTGIRRCTEKYELTNIPGQLAGLARVTINRGDFHQPAPGYSFNVNQDVNVYLAVDERGDPNPGEGWQRTDMRLSWGQYIDVVYQRTFEAGQIDIPGNNTQHKPGDYGLPHMCFLQPVNADTGQLHVTDLSKQLGARLSTRGPDQAPVEPLGQGDEVIFTLEIDRAGNGQWAEYQKTTVPADGYRYHIFDEEFDAEWIRVTVDRDCVATAYFHYSEPGHDPLSADNRRRFAAIADVRDSDAVAGLIRPGRHNRNLQYLLQRAQGQDIVEAYLEVDETMAFRQPAESRAEEVQEICQVTQDFEVDDASVIMTHKGRVYRLPKGDAAYDRAFATGWPRGIRECQSERYLMNIHGTFYETPREGGLPQIKPIATHGRQIMDFCSWRGLWVISGTKPGATSDGQYFAGDAAGLWFGAIDDIWQFGKPTGRGGPWRQAAVAPGVASDPYLMTGYDRKSVELSHDADDTVTFTIEVNFDHRGFRNYKMISVPAEQTVSHEFPAGYSTHWVRTRTDTTCTATATFRYE